MSIKAGLLILTGMLIVCRGNLRSVDDLRNQVLAFIDYFNRTMAKPFRWTYQGKPLRA